MQTSRRWFACALLAGLLYLIISVGFASLVTPSIVFWRRAAWVVSALVYSAHIAYEHFRLRNSARLVALHVALGAAVGGLGLAAAANVRSFLTETGNARLLRIALLVWPALTGIPAFVFGLIVSSALARLPRYRKPGTARPLMDS